MGKWEMVRLGDVCTFINGDRSTNYPSSKDFCEAGIPFINAGHLENDAVSFDKMNYISERKYNDLGSGKIQNGDLLYCLRGSLGKQAVVKDIDKGAIASSLVILRPENIHIDFLRYCMKTSIIYGQQEKANNGSSQPNLSAASVKNYVIPLPPSHIQQKIADILNRASALIEKRKAQIDKLDLLVKAKFVKMFGDPVTNPLGFDIVKLEDIAEIVSGVAKGRKLAERQLVRIPYMRVANVKDGSIDLSEIKMIDATMSELERYRLIPDDILMTEGGDPDKLGRGAIWKNEIDDCIHQNHIFRVRLNPKVVNPVFFAEYLRKQFVKAYFLSCAKQTTGIASINMTQLKATPTIIPSLELQNRFAAFVAGVEAQKKRQKKGLALVELNYSALMQKCFAGEVCK